MTSRWPRCARSEFFRGPRGLVACGSRERCGLMCACSGTSAANLDRPPITFRNHRIRSSRSRSLIAFPQLLQPSGNGPLWAGLTGCRKELYCTCCSTSRSGQCGYGSQKRHCRCCSLFRQGMDKTQLARILAACRLHLDHIPPPCSLNACAW